MKIETPARLLHGSLADDLFGGDIATPIDDGVVPAAEVDYDAEVDLASSASNAAMRALGLYSQTDRKGVKVKGLDTESDRPPSDTKYLVPRPTYRFGSAGEKLEDLQRRNQEIEEAVEQATVPVEATGLGGGKADVKTVFRPAKRWDIKETQDGYQVIDEADGTVIDTYMSRGEAQRRLDYERGQTEPAAEDIEYAPPRDAETDEVQSVSADENYAGFVSLGDDDLDALLADRLQTPELRDGMLGGIRMEGAGGDAKVPDEGNIRALIGSMAERIEDKIPAAERDAISLEQTRAAADVIGLDPKKLEARMRKGFNIDPTNPGALAAHIVAAKDLLVSEVRKLDELTGVAAAKEASVQDKLAWKQQAILVANIQRMYKGAQTDIGRALSALRVPNRDDAALLGRDYTRLVDDIGGMDRLNEEIDSYAAIGPGNPKAKIDLVGASSKWDRAFNALHEVWVNAILSGYWTHIKNTSGALSALMADDAVLGYTALRQFPRVFSGAERDVTFGDVQARVFGQVMAISEAFSEAGARFVSREEIYGSSKLENAVAGSTQIDAFSAEALGVRQGYAANLIDAVGQLATAGRVPTRLLVAEDTFFKVIAYRGSLYEQAYRAARERGKQGDDAGTFIADYLHNPPEQAVEEAKDTAKYITLQQELVGYPKNMQQAMRNRYMRWIVPFYKTPMNALLWMGQHSLFAPMSSRYKADIAAGGYRAARARSRMQLGTIAFGALSLKMYLDPAESGSCTGALSHDPDVVDAYRRQGVMPYSCRFGDTWIPMNMFEPVSGMISLVADVNEVLSHPDTDEKTGAEIAAAAVLTIGYGLTQKSYLEGINKFMKALTNPYGNKPKNIMRSYAKSIIPGSAAWNEIRRFNDDIKRFRTGYLDDIMDRLPGLSTRLPAERDLWGRKTSLHRAYSPYKPNAVDKEIARLRLGVEKHPTGIGDIELTPEQRDYFHKRAGEIAYKSLEDLITGKSRHSPLYKKLTESGQKLPTTRLRKQARTSQRKIINGEISKARAIAFKELERHPQFGPELEITKRQIKEFLRKEQQKIKDAIR